MQLLHGDCLELMKNIPDKSIDMVLCDLPYGTTENKWDSIIPFDKMWGGVNRIIKDNGAVVLFSQMPFTAKLVMSNFDNFRYEWIWEKSLRTGFLNARRMPLKIHENILVFYKRLPIYNPQMTSGKPYTQKQGSLSSNYGKSILVETINKGDRFPIDILRFNSVVDNFHPTQKPVALLMYLIKTYTDEKDTVLDFTMGSGSCGVACKNTNRNFIGIEKDDKYFEIAKQRIENGFVQEDVNINENSPLFE